MMKTTLLAALMAVAATAAAGCGCDGKVETVQEVHCARSGSVQVVSPTFFALPATVGPIQAQSCLTPSGLCDGAGNVVFGMPGPGADGHTFGLRIRVQPGAAPGTHTLTGNETAAISIESYLYEPNYLGMLLVRSGALVLQRNDAGGLAGTFALEGETEDGQHQVSLTGGAFDVSACAIEPRTYCFSTQS
jgi:hypothetical protein